MQTPDVKLGIGSYLGIIIFILMFVMIFMKDSIFAYVIEATGGDQIAESQKATKETADLLLSLDSIKLDTSVLNTSYLQSLTQLPTFPIDSVSISNFGKSNPFVGNFIIVPTKVASTSIGGVIYSNQREANDGNSIRAVSPTRGAVRR